MTYLDLINNVLIRLREDKIVAEQVDTDPYWRFIGSAVNDAKAHVEDAWQWGALRGPETISLTPANSQPGPFAPTYELPDSADNSYIIKNFFFASNPEKYTGLQWVSKQQMQQLHSNGTPPIGQPSRVAVVGNDPNTGNIAIVVYPTPRDTDSLIIDKVSNQPNLVAATDRLKVPPLPVYTFATALASRERGEVGGAPTSELFVMANSYLSDAIAIDSALYANELDWYSNTNEAKTNVRFS